MPRVLIVVEDRHAERELRDVLRRLAADTVSVLTADALLALVLRREQIDARLVAADLIGPAIDPLDRVALAALDTALDGGAAGPPNPRDAVLARCLQYGLIPTFVRAVRNVAVLHDALAGARVDRVVIVGGGPLAQAARLVASHLRLRVETAGGSTWRLFRQGAARLRAGRHTRWVGTEFRALALEPGFLLLLFAKGLWQRCISGRPTGVSPDALIVTGDRWTAKVVAQREESSRTIIVAGATQPGRALFRDRQGAVAIERWSEPADVVRGVLAIGSALGARSSRAGDRAGGEHFVVSGISFEPLVSGVVRRHAVVWMPVLRHVQEMVRRVAAGSPHASLLTSADATAYVGALVAAAAQVGVPSASIQHGLMGEPNGHSVVRAGVLACWGAATESWHRERAPQTARFVITGNPGFDRFPAPAVAREREPSRPFTIVVCTGFVSEFSVCASDALNLHLLQAILEWGDAREAVRVVHKLHPGEEPGYYARATAALGWGRDWFSTTSEPVLHDLLQSSDVLVTGYSTTVVESILLGTPVVVGDFERRPILPVDRIPGVSVASSVGELHRQLDAVRSGTRLAPDPTHAEVRRYVFALDGRATERVAALVDPPPSP